MEGCSVKLNFVSKIPDEQWNQILDFLIDSMPEGSNVWVEGIKASFPTKVGDLPSVLAECLDVDGKTVLFQDAELGRLGHLTVGLDPLDTTFIIQNPKRNAGTQSLILWVRAAIVLLVHNLAAGHYLPEVKGIGECDEEDLIELWKPIKTFYEDKYDLELFYPWERIATEDELRHLFRDPNFKNSIDVSVYLKIRSANSCYF